MKTKELLETTPEDLASRQYDAVKTDAISILRAMAAHLQKDDLQKAKEMIEFSPSGDGYGSDNSFISFSEIMDCFDGADIGDIISKMISLKELETAKKTK